MQVANHNYTSKCIKQNLNIKHYNYLPFQNSVMQSTLPLHQFYQEQGQQLQLVDQLIYQSKAEAIQHSPHNQL